ncbi:unnamed protein product [Mytilus coruscus]|uniref:C-type lectin domain-containing protein n=1 Tax=Mytilus coruscus TaxID=42192 RepID=A0A6J8BSP6_MYTCO|nr:unnamed protein product [Mytilus coruscus]
MGDQVDNVYELPMEGLNTSNHEYSIPINVWNDKLTDLYEASRTRDKLFVLLTVIQLICLSLAVAFIVLHFNDQIVGEHGQKGEQRRQREAGKSLTCSIDWVQFMGSCYYFQFKDDKPWDAAKDDCHGKGGFLVKIDNAVENWFLKTYIKTDSPYSVWIGAHDSQQESNFIWESDNSALTYTDWHQGEPSNRYNNENCVHMRESSDYTWNDYPCSSTESYICEKQ